ncbi:hypothetical protein [Micromonospora sp. LH3U1]|uniref:hypothetical protein n=1 Tax=Micromonospora sp. LH3U1 TaxID=3018339 RepID=UPI002349D24C|nr:hypothetical protein [Micromonospora sp. LH3U1]WCN79981.1 hypothetical protein PCA76_23890 [Micromonospora sp. LH3U1]
MPEPTDGPAEVPLTGGFIADVVRVGDTVRRTPPANLDFVGALLHHLAGVGADLAPRHLGVDARGRQMLGYVAGRVPWRDREDPAFFADPAPVAKEHGVRDFPAGPLAGGLPRLGPGRAGPPDRGHSLRGLALGGVGRGCRSGRAGPAPHPAPPPGSIMELWWGIKPLSRGEPGTTTP